MECSIVWQYFKTGHIIDAGVDAEVVPPRPTSAYTYVSIIQKSGFNFLNKLK